MRESIALRVLSLVCKFVLTFGVLIGLFVLGVYWYTNVAPKRYLLSSARVGQTREQVVKNLGKPYHIARSRSEFTGVDNWKPVPNAPIDKEVLEYYHQPHWKLYVYINRQNRVSKVVLART